MDRQLRARWKKSQFDRLKTGPAHTEANKTELEQGCAFRVNAELWLAERTSRDPARSDLIGSTISCFWVGKNIETTGCKRKLAGPMSEVVIDRNNNILSLSLSLYLDERVRVCWTVLYTFAAGKDENRRKGEKGWGKMVQRLSSKFTLRAPDLSYIDGAKLSSRL